MVSRDEVERMFNSRRLYSSVDEYRDEG